ncbi:MAG: MFS transporter [Oscillospiraceae bacterium]|nr:MFS transporter [Oscillospiraceae bacterium]
MNKMAFKYNCHQFFHWAAGPGVVNFAIPFLIYSGLSASQAGGLMAAGGLISCCTQPFMAAAVDRQGKHRLPAMTAGLAALSTLAFLLLARQGLGPVAAGGLFLLCYWAFDAAVPLLNSLGVAHSTPRQPINFGAARGAGSLASALLVLVLGHTIERWGYASQALITAAVTGAVVVICFTYPRLAPEQPASSSKSAPVSCSVPVFVGRYRWYCVSLLAILLFAASQAMADNYMLAIMERLGGGSSQMGVALSIASFSAIPVMFLFSRLRGRLGDKGILTLMAFSYLFKALAFRLAPSVPVIYAAQLFQMTTYALLAPEQVFYARSRVDPADMVKGQAFITSAFTLGCSLGNLCGGRLLDSFGVEKLLLAILVFAGLGCIILFFSMNKKDKAGLTA